MENDPLFLEWIQRRVKAVEEVYSVFDILQEIGDSTVPDSHTATQIPCKNPDHGPDRKPSARYYPKNGKSSDAVRCFKCRETWRVVSFYGLIHNVKFMESLSRLERRFNIKIPKRPETSSIDPIEKSYGYKSPKWSDIPTLLRVCEKKLLWIRSRCPLLDYVKFCRVIDIVDHDYDRLGKSLPEMVHALTLVMLKMDDIMTLPENLNGH